MNEEEVQIDLVTLLHYILRKWRSIIVMMLILAVAANLYSVRKNMAEVAAAGEVQEKSTKKAVEEIKTALTDDEIEQVELAYRMYSYNAEIYRDNEQYLENSAVMQLSSNEIPTEMLSYQVKKDAAEEELVNIFAMYENALLDEDTCTAVVSVFGEKYANTSVRELIRIEDTLNASHTDVLMTQGMNSGILNIRIYATDQEQCERIAEIIKDRMQVYTQQLQQTFGQFIVNSVAEQYYMSSDNEINEQKSDAIDAVGRAYSAMQNASAGLTEDQMTYYNLLVKPIEEEKVQENHKGVETAITPTVQYVNIKYILIGLFAGMFLAVCWYAVIYIMTQTVKDADEVKAVTNLPVFGMVLKNKKAEKGNRIDRWIDSWFAHGRKSEDTEILLMRISHEVAMLAEQKNMQHLLLTVYESNGEETREYAEDLAEKLSELGMTVTCADGLISNNTEVLKQLEYADGAVFVEQLMKSDRKEIRDAVALCERCKVEVLGNVVIGSDSY